MWPRFPDGFKRLKTGGADGGFTYIPSTMRIVHDKEVCANHGQCVGAAPELFKFADDGSLIVIDPNPPEELREAAQDAVDVCPVLALAIVED
ncbi:MAG: ferredoxin [Myxococcales bacterium]|nr:ferredoxin [Myxococcales bacterium]